jgi:predicted GIY-YIG superfamily endonuclease
MKSVKLTWSNPTKIDSALKDYSSIESHWGLYCISRIFGRKETILYIGYTFNQSFSQRIHQHNQNWIKTYRGKKIVRFGYFLSPLQITEDLIKDVESCLIFELCPVKNKSKTKSYTPKTELQVLNKGNKLVLPNKISMKDH